MVDTESGRITSETIGHLDYFWQYRRFNDIAKLVDQATCTTTFRRKVAQVVESGTKVLNYKSIYV